MNAYNSDNIDLTDVGWTLAWIRLLREALFKIISGLVWKL